MNVQRKYTDFNNLKNNINKDYNGTVYTYLNPNMKAKFGGICFSGRKLIKMIRTITYDGNPNNFTWIEINSYNNAITKKYIEYCIDNNNYTILL
jgi:hypothetical protein